MIDWRALDNGGFQNALAMGLQMGQIARQQKDASDYRNALAQFDPSRPETIDPIMKVDPETGLQLRGQMQQAQAAAAEQRNIDGQTYVRLLEAAKDNPQQAYGAAQQMGLDLSGVPPVGSPEFETWRRNSLFVMRALSDPEKLTQVQQDARALGLDLNTPEGAKAVQELTLYKYAKNGVDEYGRPTLELPQIGMPGQAQQAPAPQQPRQPQQGQLLPRTARPAGLTDDQLFAQARQAVEQGASVDAVFQQLREWGVEVN